MGDGPYQLHYDEVVPAQVAGAVGWDRMDIRFLVGETTTSREVALWRAEFEPRPAQYRDIHDAAESCFVVSGHGAAGTEDREYEVSAGSAVEVPPGGTH